jgi:chromosome segregation ATPase
MVEPLLTFADELERRDASVAAQLARVESLQAEVEEIRTHARAAVDFLASLPAALAGHARDEEQAEADRAAAQRRLGEAEQEKDETARVLAVRRAHDAIADAERRVERAREHQAVLEREGAERRDEGVRLAERAGVAALDAVLPWASQRRGELVLEGSGLARERDAVVREASELLASVLGDPLAATSVAGLRARLERALP